jgi:predicted transcriptional regulator
LKTLKKYGIQFNDDDRPAALKHYLGLSKTPNETSVLNYITDPKQTILGSIKVSQVLKDVSAYKTQGICIFIKLKNLLLVEEKAVTAL